MSRMRASFAVLLLACSPADPVGEGSLEVRIGPVTPGAPQRGPAVAVAGDGSVWVSWVEGTGADTSLAVAWSPDGSRFSAPVTWALGEAAPIASLARRPRIAVSEDRVAVVFADGIYPDARVWLHVADRSRLDDVDVRLLDETGPDQDTLDQPTVAFAPDGSLWASWKVGLDHDVALVLAGEGDDFAIAPVDGFPGLPCPCCPHELGFDGDVPVMMQRGDELDLREIYLGRRQTDGSFAASRVSRNGWVVGGCPFDGPRWARLDDGRWLAAWMDATPGEPSVWTATSDDGVTWSDGERALPDATEPLAFPVPVVSGETVWLVAEELFQRARLLRDDGAGLVEEPLTTPGGALLQVDGAAGGGNAGLVGIADGAVWFVPLR